MTAAKLSTFPLKHATDLLFREVTGRVQVCRFTADGDALLEIDGVAAQVWLKIDGTRGANEIIKEVLSGVSERHHQRCRLDCEAFLQELLDKKMIIEIDPK